MQIAKEYEALRKQAPSNLELKNENLKKHRELLTGLVKNFYGSPKFLLNLNQLLNQTESVQKQLEAKAQTYYAEAKKLATLAEQTLITADHSYQVSKSLTGVASAYPDLFSDKNYITYWRAVNVDASGRVAAEVYGNGIVSHYSYDQATGQLNSIHSNQVTSNRVRHLEYSYDDYNNVKTRNDHVNDIQETFTYDRLDRLVNTNVASAKYKNLAGQQAQSYDNLGNITYKSDVGSYSYGNNAGPNAVTSAGGKAYTYDKNGNMLTGNGRTIVWTSFNKARHIQKQGANSQKTSATFFYGADRSRFMKFNHKGEMTVYIGGIYEKLTRGKNVDQKHYIYAAGNLVAEHIVSTEHGIQTRYMHKDALGSIDLITDNFGNVVDRRSFDAWGKMRDFEWKAGETTKDPNYITQLPFTNKAYTGHENIQEVDLIHMNGRVYDATLARFISADPHIQFAGSSQSYNRYSYVMNNPMKYTDPSGYFLGKVGKAIKKVWNAVRPFVGIIVAAVVTWACMGTCGGPVWAAALAGAAGGAAGAAANGGNIFRAAVMGGITGAIGGMGGNLGTRMLVGGLSGGAMAVINGGKFGRGFLSSAFTVAAMPQGGGWGNTIRGVVVGGTASVIGGGKFKNGAMSVAYSYTVRSLVNASVSVYNSLKKVAPPPPMKINVEMPKANTQLDTLTGMIEPPPLGEQDFTFTYAGADGKYKPDLISSEAYSGVDMNFGYSGASTYSGGYDTGVDLQLGMKDLMAIDVAYTHNEIVMYSDRTALVASNVSMVCPVCRPVSDPISIGASFASAVYSNDLTKLSGFFGGKAASQISLKSGVNKSIAENYGAIMDVIISTKNYAE